MIMEHKGPIPIHARTGPRSGRAGRNSLSTQAEMPFTAFIMRLLDSKSPQATPFRLSPQPNQSDRETTH
jgi:hypothetical protein